ncbi:zinc finger MYM-type 1-like [Pelobates cultripes]|uniref:Zinc finger MYM-type 1-like n=1 Tax=Pelobates cultripes TaxID=61616 RepID=A0AAD1WEN7_PELCU|nr:zinc finger MYM-type 1-like [Pelobates cultripes]
MSKPLSGAQKRKKKQELEEKICRIPKITGFLLPTSGSSAQPSAQPSACGSSQEHASTCSQEEIPPQSVSEYGSETDTVDSSDQPMPLETTPVPMEVEKPSFHTAESVDILPESMEKSGFLTEIGLWPNSSTLEMWAYWSKNGNSSVRKPPEQLQNEGFPKSFKDGRCCTADMFLCKYPNGDKVELKWLCYSNSRGQIYCFDCKLFSSSTNAFSSDGFSDCKHASERISSHEQSQHHIRIVIDTAKFSKLEGRIDYKMQQQIEDMTTYGQNLVKCLLSVTVFLAERGLAFRGDDQTIGSPHNGNYLGILELLSDGSTRRYKKLKDKLDEKGLSVSMPKKLSDTRCVLKSLKDFINEQHTKFDAFEEAGKRLTDTEEYIVGHRRHQRRNVRQQPLDYGHSEEAQLMPKEAFYAKVFLPYLHKLLTCLEHRLGAYSEVCDLFGFFINFPTMDSESIKIAAGKLSAFYKQDLGTTFGDELIQFQSLISLFLDEKPDDCSIEQFMYSTINNKDVRDTFPNTEIALKIYLTLMITNSSGERSFSKMKLIKNLQRTTMSQIRLTKLSIMSAESEILRGLDFLNITKTFAAQKARRLIG